MMAGDQIQYLSHKEIDKEKWDTCITNAPNGFIYSYTFYLDCMAKHWDALVFGDYEAVMPLTWRKKYDIYYLYQPFLTPQLGIIGRHLTEAFIEKFLHTIPQRFRFWEINLNIQNTVQATPDFSVFNKANYLMSLKEDYRTIRSQYRQNHKRSIQKALDAGCVVQKNITLQDVISLARQQLDQYTSYSTTDITQFIRLCELLQQQQKAVTYGIYAENKLLSSCIFFLHQKRAYYILTGNHPESRTIGASHLLLDHFIKEQAGKDWLLDFVGSDIASIGSFYEGFGAFCQYYPSLRLNKLPFILRWLKG